MMELFSRNELEKRGLSSGKKRRKVVETGFRRALNEGNLTRISICVAFAFAVTAYVLLSRHKDALFAYHLSNVSRMTLGPREYAERLLTVPNIAGMKITEAEWNATVSALKAALDENKVGENEQNDLIAALAPMKDDIVEVKPKPGKK